MIHPNTVSEAAIVTARNNNDLPQPTSRKRNAAGGLFNPPLAPPKDGCTYRILLVSRVSDPRAGKQDERSLGDQEMKLRELLQDNIEMPMSIMVVSGSGSGEQLEREAYLKVLDLVDSRQFDLVLTEDLGRIVRRIHAHLFAESCEDSETRLLAINDHVDTAQPGWREASIFSAFHHERSNRDTSERIKRTHRSRFVNGGCLSLVMYGWVKPADAKSDADVQKDPNAEVIYKEWFRMLDEDEATFADVARWLRKQDVPLPPYARSIEWTPTLVARHTFNVMLKGWRERNRRKTKRVNKTGKYVSRKAGPEDLLRRHVPHLAFFREAYFDRVVGAVRERNAKFRRSDDPAADPCLNRPKKATRFPGRVTFCGICGRPFVWGGHGQTDHLMCNGARMHRCWNGVTFDGVEAGSRIAAAVLCEVMGLPDFDATFLGALDEEGRRLDESRQQKIAEIERELQQTSRGITNIVGFIRAGNAPLSLGDELRTMEEQKARLSAELVHLQETATSVVQIPPLDEIRGLIQQSIQGLATSDQEFAVIMRKLVPRILVFPHRLCDGGAVVLRAKLRLELGSLLPDRKAVEVLRQPLTRLIMVDLFDSPQREQVRQRIVAARAAGKSERQAAEECRITVTAAQRAAVLQRMMDREGLIDPYVPVTVPPEDCPKLKRHRHGDYRFEPLPTAGEL